MIQAKHYSSPFDFYDFFGYLFPGFIMMIYLYSFVYHHNEKFAKWHESAINFCFSSIFYTIFLVILFIIGIYLIGHLIATLGSMILDRVFMNGVFGFPHNFLLEINDEKGNIIIQKFYKAIFLDIHVLIISTIFTYLFHWLDIVFYIFLFHLFITGLIFIICSYVITTKNWTIDNFTSKWYIEWIFIGLNVRIADYILTIIKVIVNNNKPFSTQVITEYSKHFKSKFGLDYKIAKDDNLWLPYFYVTSLFPNQESVLRKWHHLYGYTRNICCASFLYCGFLVVVMHSFTFTTVSIYNELLIIYIISFVFYMRYINLYQNYLLKNVIRSFIATISLDNDTENND